jgi:hypothetical protein
MGDYEAADFEMRRAADLDVGYLTQVLDLVWRFYGDPELIVRTHVPNSRAANLSALDYFISQGSELGADLVWDRLRTFDTEPTDRFAYVEYLLMRNLGREAHAVFAHGLPAEELAGVFNGGFERRPMNGGFDWRFSSTDNEEVRWVTEPQEGFHSLRIRFGGQSNAAFRQVTHRVIVQAGRAYQLRFWVRTDGISTDQGAYVEIDGERSDAPLGTTDWQELAIPFTASSDLALIQVRRDPSDKLDNRVQGTVWLDEFVLSIVE